jgi:uncharacterized protein YycO
MNGADKKRVLMVISVIIIVLIKLVTIVKSMVSTTLMTQNPSNRLTKHLQQS